MIKEKYLFVAVLVFLVTAAVANAESKFIHKKYQNVRFSYEVSYPEGLLIPQGEADNSDGQRFLSMEHDVEMAVWGSNNVFEETLESEFLKESENDTKKHPELQITYKHCSDNWFVVSGIKGDQVFYQKTIFMNNTFLSCHITYPLAKKQKWDTVTASISKSFKYIGARP